jgi:hypothetical protein
MTLSLIRLDRKGEVSLPQNGRSWLEQRILLVGYCGAKSDQGNNSVFDMLSLMAFLLSQVCNGSSLRAQYVYSWEEVQDSHEVK